MTDANDQTLRWLAASLRETAEAPALVAEFLAHFELAADASPTAVLAAMARLVLWGTGDFDEPCGRPECPCARRSDANVAEHSCDDLCLPDVDLTPEIPRGGE